MAHKASPYAVRLDYNQDYNTFFFAENEEEQINLLLTDQAIRDYLHSNFPDIDRLKTEYTKNAIFIYLYMPEVNLVLEDKSKLEKIMKGIYKIVNDDKIKVSLDLIKVKNIYTHAQSTSNLVVSQLKKRVPSRQVIRKLLERLTFEKEIKGVKIEISGRLDEADIAQTKKIVHEKMPLSAMVSKVEEGFKPAITSYGVIGVKILFYKGKIQPRKNKNYANT